MSLILKFEYVVVVLNGALSRQENHYFRGDSTKYNIISYRAK
jgi:hypothetical protein